MDNSELDRRIKYRFEYRIGTTTYFSELYDNEFYLKADIVIDHLFKAVMFEKVLGNKVLYDLVGIKAKQSRDRYSEIIDGLVLTAPLVFLDAITEEPI